MHNHGTLLLPRVVIRHFATRVSCLAVCNLFRLRRSQAEVSHAARVPFFFCSSCRQLRRTQTEVSRMRRSRQIARTRLTCRSKILLGSLDERAQYPLKHPMCASASTRTATATDTHSFCFLLPAWFFFPLYSNPIKRALPRIKNKVPKQTKRSRHGAQVRDQVRPIQPGCTLPCTGVDCAPFGFLASLTNAPAAAIACSNSR